MNFPKSKLLKVVTFTLFLSIMVFASADIASAQGYKSWRPKPNLHNFHMHDFEQPRHFGDCFGGCGRDLYDTSSLLNNDGLFDNSILDMDPMSTLLKLAPKDKSKPFSLSPSQLYNWRQEKYENCMERMARVQPHGSWSEWNAACAHHKVLPRR